MKKMFLLTICIMLLMIFFTSCYGGEKNSYNNDDILNFMGIENLDCEVIDIKVQKKAPLTIFAELYVSEEEFSKNEYFQRKQELIAPGAIKKLEEYGVKVDSIIEFGVNYKDFIIKNQFSTEYRPYYIYWYKIPQAPNNKSNILIRAIIPND